MNKNYWIHSVTCRASASALVCGMMAGMLMTSLHADEAKGADAGSLMYRSYENVLVLKESGFTVRKKSGRAQLHHVVEYPGNSDIQLSFRDSGSQTIASLTIYRAPKGTTGPTVILDENGKPMLEDPAKNPNGVFALSDPSESYLKEFNQRIEFMEETFPLECKTNPLQPVRMLAVPGDLKRSPVAQVVYFEGNGGFRGPHLAKTPWLWEFRLYAHRGWFVKIHTEGPSPGKDGADGGLLAALGPIAFASDVARAVEWLEVADEPSAE